MPDGGCRSPLAVEEAFPVHEYLMMGLVAIVAVMLAKVVFPKVPVLNGLAGYL